MTKIPRLTQKQKKVYETIVDYFGSHGESPTLQELREKLGLSSIRSVTQYLEALERKGLIRRNRFQKRNIVLLNQQNDAVQNTVNVRVMASAGCDQTTVFADERYDDYMMVDRSFIPQNSQVVAIQAIGNSMQSAGIKHGDYALVEVTEDVQENDRVAVILGENAVIKRIHFGDNAVILSPDSDDPQYKPIIMKEGSSGYKIFGKVIDVIKTNVSDNEIRHIPIAE